MAYPTIATIEVPDLATLPPTPAKITNFKHLASYTWWDKPTPTISVPGSPPLWSPPSSATRLEPDSGMVYVDQNAARCPSSPLEPLLRAVLIENPDFSLHDVDLVTDRNNIRKLWRFVQWPDFVQGSPNNDFKIRVEMIGDTALFTRVEPKVTETIRGFCGFGHNFEKAYTKTSLGMSGYHRIVSYDFGGLKCVVRHETDGYLGQGQGQGLGELPDGLSGLSLFGSEKTASGLTVVTCRSGNKTDLPVSSTLEIKTRASHRRLMPVEVLPQLWVSQTPKLAVGYHHQGVFNVNEVKVQDMADEILRWEGAHQEGLRMLAGLLSNIIDVVKTVEDRRAVVEFTGGNSLHVVADGGRPALPKDLYAKLTGDCTGEVRNSLELENDKENAAPNPPIPAGTPFASDMEYVEYGGDSGWDI